VSSEATAETIGEATGLRQRLYQGWMGIVARFANTQTLLLLVLFYVTLIGPTSLVQRIGRRDSLDKGGLGRRDSAWQPSESGGTDLERAKLLS